MNDLQRPFVGVGVIIPRADGHFLLGQRIGSHGLNTWSFPGGHLEFGETWEGCAAREAAEETGIVVHRSRFVALTNDIHTETNKHYITIFMLAEQWEGSPTDCEPHKCLGWGWYPWDALPRPLFLPVENLISQGFHPNQCSVLTVVKSSATLSTTFSP
ncbi:MAG: NUDIX hydrolase [Patescibacteria group bacterium]